MASVCVDRPHRDTCVALRPSRFLRGAMAGFAGVAGASVFQCVFAWTAQAGQAAVMCAAALATLGLASYRWMRAQPSAISLLSDGVAIRSRAGEMRQARIAGCAQWSDRLLALTLVDARERRETLIVAADSVDADTFRQLSVLARRAAASHL
ncbi:protein YgfX [Caballeronia sp. J97]|uniref:protein YgfX n=1 Tax=Caballeronia sp. J97 TaxID=2805429 RepID=UPI002AB2ACBC|nr:protein YgfX [Caballeronia sp. J97]